MDGVVGGAGAASVDGGAVSSVLLQAASNTTSATWERFHEIPTETV